MKRTLPTLLCAVVAAAAAAPPAAAFLGFGKKKEQTVDTPKLPGIPADAEGQEGSRRPRMSDEAPAGAPPPSLPAEGSRLPTEVVIRGEHSNKIGVNKPPLKIEIDPFESIRGSLKPDESLLLAESPLTISWRRTHPEFLQNNRVVEPWRTTFSEKAGIAFYPRQHLAEVVGRKLDPKEAKAYQWALTIADEEGRVFQHYEGSSNPPEELLWSGQNDQGEWIKAGRAYSPIFMFTDSGGSPHTKVGKTLQFTGIVHQEPDGLHISLDSSVLFGNAKASRELEKAGRGLVRSAADLIKRRYSGVPIRVQAYASTKDLGETQARLVQEYLVSELMLQAQNVGVEGAHGAFAEQRVEVILLNR